MFGKQKPEFQQAFYDETVGKVRPKRVIPIHWDNFFQPLSDHLEAMPQVVDNLEQGFDFLISRTKKRQYRIQHSAGLSEPDNQPDRTTAGITICRPMNCRTASNSRVCAAPNPAVFGHKPLCRTVQYKAAAAPPAARRSADNFPALRHQ